MARFVDFIFIILISLGIFYTFTPPDVKIKYSPEFILFGINLPYDYHIFIGIILFILAYDMYYNFKINF